ncbi:helix-turn-helix domain-containing protein [Streptomyces sp. NRRL F-5527]|uniref:helix-turn-helix domain-containing protein n=1 Tax=Streptomyces sp. NRRL F-5527 TaxID=1463862 RepID=UPI0007C7C659|nr:helix-turn-helix transcriptional regulator [Streptomyces sp. NRRL F-5527]
MTTDTLASPPCAPQCDVPSLPPVVVGALMRLYRTRAGLSGQQAADIIGTSSSRIGALEQARAPISATTAAALLGAYGAPDREVQEARALLTHPGHQHSLDGFAPSEAWVEALQASARYALVYSAGPLPASLLPLTDKPALAAPGRRPASSHRCRTVLLLHESVLERTPDGLSRLIRLAEDGAITMHLVPEPLPEPVSLLAEFTCTAWGWDGSNAQRLRRQVYVARHLIQAQGGVLNGPAATGQRQLMEEAVRRALPSPWSLRQLRQAAHAQQQSSTAASGSRAARPAAPAQASTRDRRARRSA